MDEAQFINLFILLFGTVERNLIGLNKWKGTETASSR